MNNGLKRIHQAFIEEHLALLNDLNVHFLEFSNDASISVYKILLISCLFNAP